MSGHADKNGIRLNERGINSIRPMIFSSLSLSLSLAGVVVYSTIFIIGRKTRRHDRAVKVVHFVKLIFNDSFRKFLQLSAEIDLAYWCFSKQCCQIGKYPTKPGGFSLENCSGNKRISLTQKSSKADGLCVSDLATLFLQRLIGMVNSGEMERKKAADVRTQSVGGRTRLSEQSRGSRRVVY